MEFKRGVAGIEDNTRHGLIWREDRDISGDVFGTSLIPFSVKNPSLVKQGKASLHSYLDWRDMERLSRLSKEWKYYKTILSYFDILGFLNNLELL